MSGNAYAYVPSIRRASGMAVTTALSSRLGTAALDSIRALLDQQEETVGLDDTLVRDVIGELLAEASKGTQVREALRRQVV